MKKSSYAVFIETKDGTHKPIKVGVFSAVEPGDALTQAGKVPAVKKILGNQQTGQLKLSARLA